MKVSVIMPVYNADTRHKFITKAIDSFLNQDCDKELIIVNDGSTDNTENSIANYLDIEEIVYIKQDNAGQGNAENTGIKRATGELITFLDDDDLLEDDSLQNRMNAFEVSTECVIGRYYEINPSSIKIAPHPQSEDELKESIWRTPGIVASQALMWRKFIHERIGYISEDISSVEDYEWKLKVITECNIKLINDFVYKYRYHPNMRSDKHRRSGLLDKNKAIVLKRLTEKYK